MLFMWANSLAASILVAAHGLEAEAKACQWQQDGQHKASNYSTNIPENVITLDSILVIQSPFLTMI